MSARQRARYGQPEPDAAGRTVTRSIQPHEPLEDPLTIGFGDTGTVVVDGDERL